MKFLDFFKGKKNQPKIEKIDEDAKEILEAGIEQTIRKKQIERQNAEKPEEIVLENYEPKIPIEESMETEPEVMIEEQSTEECLVTLEENCEQIVEAQRQNENAKIEYQAVTEYMADVQKIERMEEGERKLLTETSEKIMALSKQREDFQKRDVQTSHPCFRAIRHYDGSMMEELKKVRENEEYAKKVHNDLRQLEAEKAALKYEYKELNKKQSELKKIMVVTVIIVISLFALFWVLAEGLERSMAIPYIMTVLMAAIISGYVFYEAYQNKYQHAVIGKKINRAIQLSNKVKIKYINNTNALEYSYSKYNIRNSMELEYLMKEYSKSKELERTYESNTERLHHYREKLVDILNVHELKDSEIWIYQVNALVDNAELESIKMNLEERRAKLVERMDYNLQVKDNCYNAIHMIISVKTELKEQVLPLFEKYHISL